LSGHRDYSHVPLAKKLGFKPGFTAIFFNAPEGFSTTMEDALNEVTCLDSPREGAIDLALLFCADQGSFVEGFRVLKPSLRPTGMLWVAWPKKSSKVPTDLTFEFIQPFGLAEGLVDVKVCAIDETWTAMKFVYRLKDR
jgi:hypothetical protein